MEELEISTGMDSLVKMSLSDVTILRVILKESRAVSEALLLEAEGVEERFFLFHG